LNKLNKYLKAKKCPVWDDLTVEEGSDGISEHEAMASYLATDCVPQKSVEDDRDKYKKAELAMSTAEIYFGCIVQE